MKKIHFIIFIIFLPSALAPGVGARDLGQDEALGLREQGKIIALETLITTINKRYPDSSVLEVELEEDDNAYIYEVELVTKEGAVREIDIDAHSGKILHDEADD